VKKWPVLIVAAALVYAGGQHPGVLAQAGQHAASGPVTVNANEVLGDQLAAAFGWAGSQDRCLGELWQQESGWSQYADTRKTGLDPPGASVFAYGIAQARPYSKMPVAGWPADKGGQSDAETQVRWGLEYLSATPYGTHTPCGAWDHETAYGWY
jgi:hypothetical protein